MKPCPKFTESFEKICICLGMYCLKHNLEQSNNIILTFMNHLISCIPRLDNSLEKCNTIHNCQNKLVVDKKSIKVYCIILVTKKYFKFL